MPGRLLMDWIREKNPYRSLREGRCLVWGCSAVCRLEGPWGPGPGDTAFFYMASDADGVLPGGWLYVRKTWLHYPDVRGARGLFCPDHAPVWRLYLREVQAWDAARRAARKTHWLAFLTRWFGPAPVPPPVHPFDPEDYR